jgi:uncharacterized membrane protein
VVIFLVICWLSTGPKLPGNDSGTLVSRAAEPFMAAPHFAAVSLTIQARCSMCHTAEPVWDGVHEAPKGVHLDSDQAIASHAKDIAVFAGYSHAMPPGNVTEMSADERALLVAWYREGSGQ